MTYVAGSFSIEADRGGWVEAQGDGGMPCVEETLILVSTARTTWRASFGSSLKSAYHFWTRFDGHTAVSPLPKRWPEFVDVFGEIIVGKRSKR